MTELGGYILGATALAILAAVGVATGNHAAAAFAVLASGAAYVGQLGAAMVLAGPNTKVATLINLVGMAVALAAWLFGALSL